MVVIDFFETFSSFYSFVKKTKNELIIICPYIKSDSIKRVISRVQENVNVLVVGRWRLIDIIMGSSDLEVYDLLKKKNIEFYINHKIHLKVLLRDKNKILLGSANLSGSGMGLLEESNIEVVTILDFDNKYLRDINKIIKTSIKMDDDLYGSIKEELENLDDLKKIINKENTKINNAEKKIFKGKYNIIVNDFPFCKDPDQFIDYYSERKFKEQKLDHDMALFGISKKEKMKDLKKKLKQKFLRSDAFSWQDKIIKDEVLFGKYCERLHNALVDDPKPYRKQVKELVNNMFNWTEESSDKYKFKKYKKTTSVSKRK